MRTPIEFEGKTYYPIPRKNRNESLCKHCAAKGTNGQKLCNAINQETDSKGGRCFTPQFDNRVYWVDDAGYALWRLTR